MFLTPILKSFWIKTYSLLGSLLIILCIYACKNNHSNRTENLAVIKNDSISTQEKTILITPVVENIDTIQLPISLSICSNSEIKKGILFKNETFYLIIDKLIGDCLIPILKTYSIENDSLIDEFSVTTGSCANDCGYYCSESFYIDTELDFTSKDTITEYPCDSNGFEDKTKQQISIHKLNGRITREGKIITEKLIIEKLIGN